jgi:hypothetical protein
MRLIYNSRTKDVKKHETTTQRRTLIFDDHKTPSRLQRGLVGSSFVTKPVLKQSVVPRLSWDV